ncbi:hypothetical protein FSS13T_04190 [Flavobacterium saliperosum S13]|uniref:Lipoprotein n=1 Tax=Flavobacterium saliperosum S13 TaxID=1341155 RepID=A0ABP3A5I1_9FLAO|nr:hypothetical protein FSS13T_04190 [Flavobacterium saliperosum S13]
MKKAICFMVLCGLLISCGPRRLGCGPGRCEVVKTQKNYERDC